MHLVGRGAQIRLAVTFYELAGGDPYDPEGLDEPSVEIFFDISLVAGPFTYADGTGQVTRTSTGVYTYNWTVPPDAELGVYTVKWSGTVYGTAINVQDSFEVLNAGIAITGETSGLADDYYITFLSELDPMYVSVEEIKPLFGDATDVEIAEAIHNASSEVDYYFPDVGVPPLIAFEYVKAATACALSRVYEYGFGGAEMAVRLADLSISSRPVGAKAVSRGTAASWCELAAALREEMLKDSVVGGKAGMKAANKGSAFYNPMPRRYIRRHD